jgi:hypothetical protein
VFGNKIRIRFWKKKLYPSLSWAVSSPTPLLPSLAEAQLGPAHLQGVIFNLCYWKHLRGVNVVAGAKMRATALGRL